MEILFRGIAKKTGQPVIGYHLKMLNEHGEMVDKIYKNCGYDKEEWGFMEIEPGSLEFFLDGKEANKPFKFDFAGVKSFECRCGQKFINTTGEGWIPISERTPTKEECENKWFWITYGSTGNYSTEIAKCRWIEADDENGNDDSFSEFYIDQEPLGYAPSQNLIQAWKIADIPDPYIIFPKGEENDRKLPY